VSKNPWKLRGPAPHDGVDSLAEELGVSSVTASVLVRRGYGEPERARAFLDAELPEHDPFRLGDMTAACETTTRTASARPRSPS